MKLKIAFLTLALVATSGLTNLLAAQAKEATAPQASPSPTVTSSPKAKPHDAKKDPKKPHSSPSPAPKKLTK